MELFNLTPHSVRVYDINNHYVDYPKSDCPARVEIEKVETWNKMMDNRVIIVRRAIMGKIVNLPEAKEGIGYVVSRMVAERLPIERRDVFFPGPAIRAEDGTIEGCQGLEQR